MKGRTHILNLSQNILFRGISPEDCQRMEPCLRVRKAAYKSGQVIHDFGQDSGNIGILCSGRASLVRLNVNGTRTILETLGPDNLFGEQLAFSDGKTDCLYVCCEADCTVLFLNYDDITKRCANACRCHSRLVENLLELISKKTLRLSQRIEVLSQRSIREKLLACFRLLAIEAESPAFTLPFNTSELADYICADRSAMLRELSKMKQEGLVWVQRRQIRLPDFEEKRSTL